MTPDPMQDLRQVARFAVSQGNWGTVSVFREERMPMKQGSGDDLRLHPRAGHRPDLPGDLLPLPPDGEEPPTCQGEGVEDQFIRVDCRFSLHLQREDLPDLAPVRELELDLAHEEARGGDGEDDLFLRDPFLLDLSQQ
jgi:hypothetical protein